MGRELPVPKHSCPSFIEPILIRDCGNRGEASIRRMSSGQTLRFQITVGNVGPQRRTRKNVRKLILWRIETFRK